MAAPATPRSSTSRIGVTITTPDEGRFLPGTLIAGRYRIMGLLGRGGMGEVYRATDLTLAQSVALKFLPHDAAHNERLLERFHNEVRVARQVSHPNVCRVYDIGEADGVPFISMEYVDGEDLASLLQRIGRLPADKALEIARKICAGLAAAHERGIIHRDLKPHNIMLNRRGEVVVMDFGLAAVADELRGAEARDGTPAYMSPEQLRGGSVTSKSDIYALGLIIYELFTGKRAFEAASLQELVRMQESSRPASMSSLASDVDPAVEKVVLRCLQSDAAQRPSSALAVAAALPGGDPLAAALAAGETPSPELVAASGKAEGFALRYAAPCLAVVLLGVLIHPFAVRNTSLLAVAPPELPPAVLEQKAREYAAELGYSQRPTDWWTRLSYESSATSHFEKQDGPKQWRTIFAARPPIELIYRSSPEYLLAPPDGTVDVERPAMRQPGMLHVRVDTSGRLRNFQAIAPREDAENSAPATFDPGAVFRLAGLDIARFQETAPKYVPPLAFDARRAWAGSYPGLESVPITVETASYRGRLTSFFIRWPWTKLPSAAPSQGSGGFSFFGLFTGLFAATGLFFVIFIARRNLRQGRGDRNGARRIAAAALLLYTAASFCAWHIVPRGEMFGYVFYDMGFGVALAMLFWLLYIALEPVVRARWPHSLITWNRALAAQFGDPRVGSHILIGAAAGTLLFYVFALREYWGAAAGGGPPNVGELQFLMGPKAVTGRMAMLLFGAFQTGAIIFFLLCGVRALVRRDWIAALAASCLLALQGGLQDSKNLFIDIPLMIAVFAAIAFLLLRMGLVPAITLIVAVNTLGRVPIGPEFSSWYNPVGIFMLAFIAGIGLFGFWRSQSRPTPAQWST